MLDLNANRFLMATAENYVENFVDMVEPFKQFKSARSDLIQTDSTKYDDMQMKLPSDDMNGMPESEQPAIYNRLIYSNKKSRNYANGDFIRGDLPIAPNSGKWFVSSINNPETDLNQGAINIIAGANNETARRTQALRNSFSSGTLKTVEGNMGPGRPGLVNISSMG